MAATTENFHAGEFLAWSTPISIEEVTIVSGAGNLAAGTVLGKIDTGGKYTPYDDGLSNGAETAVAVLLHPVDATSADKTANVVTRLAKIAKTALSWHASADATAKTAAYTALALKYIIAE